MRLMSTSRDQLPFVRFDILKYLYSHIYEWLLFVYFQIFVSNVRLNVVLNTQTTLNRIEIESAGYRGERSTATRIKQHMCTYVYIFYINRDLNSHR